MREEAPYASLGHDVVNDVRNKNHTKTEGAHEPSQHVIVGELIGEDFESADGAQGGATARDGRTKSMTQALEVRADERSRQEPLVDEHRPES